ncbi:MAG: DUF2207 family protein, partial [Coprobacillaceae bacterium]
ITDVDYKAVVVDEEGSDGKVIVTERLTYDIHAMSEDNPFWELWRDLPEEYIDGVKVEYKVNSVKQIFEDGSELEYQESPNLYWEDYDYTGDYGFGGPDNWYHSEGPYSESSRQYECVFFYIDGIYRDTVTFEIEYEMYNASLRYNDCSELYLAMYSEESIKHLNSFTGEILIPEDKMPSSNNYYANTYGTNSHAFPFEESVSKNPGYYTFSFDLEASDLKFNANNQYIEFALVSYGEDKHKFTEYASKNTYYYDDVLDELEEEQAEYDAIPAKWQKMKVSTLTVSVVSSFLILGLTFVIIRRIKKKHAFYKSTMEVEYFRDIPSDLDPSFAAELVFCKHKKSDTIDDKYSATMLSLVHKGYIGLERINSNRSWDFNNMKMIIKYNPTVLQPEDVTATNVESQPLILQPTEEPQIQQDASSKEQALNMKPLTPTEDQYFKLILRHSKGVEITLRSFQNKVSNDYEYTNTFVRLIKVSLTTIGVSNGYFQKLAYKQPKEQANRWSTVFWIFGLLFITVANFISYQTYLGFAFGSFFILGFTCIVSAIYLSIRAKKFILLTQFGEDEYAKWRGLYNFLNSETLMKEKTVIDIVLWEQYLIYATAFGISEKVIKALQIRCPNIETSPILSNPYYRSRAFRIGSRSFRTATRSAARTSRSGSWHGGYGGGGRGGGGGGGGH